MKTQSRHASGASSANQSASTCCLMESEPIIMGEPCHMCTNVTDIGRATMLRRPHHITT